MMCWLNLGHVSQFGASHLVAIVFSTFARQVSLFPEGVGGGQGLASKQELCSRFSCHQWHCGAYFSITTYDSCFSRESV